MNHRDHVVSSTYKMKSCIKCIQYHLGLRIQKRGQIYRSLEFTFDPENLVRDPLKIITHVFDQGFGVGRAGEVE